MESVNYNGVDINYTVIRKRNKNLYARMDENKNVIVTVPYLVSKKSIEKFVVESYFKLEKKINKRKKSVSNDGKIKILGEEYDSMNIEDLNYLISKKLKEYVKENYINICMRMGINNIPTLKFKRVKGYLGEYNKKTHTISLNILIAHLDKECVEYVIIHELCHIKYMNHQLGFWNEVSKHCSNYMVLRKKCKKEFVYYENY